MVNSITLSGITENIFHKANCINSKKKKSFTEKCLVFGAGGAIHLQSKVLHYEFSVETRSNLYRLTEDI